mmetsp:Transcript_8101/g.50126  ORF Transcript_8101/g.50126 Transcript_8101/m.50126 type:complete len:94 (-) Transcript_8101:667-948(-)
MKQCRDAEVELRYGSRLCTEVAGTGGLFSRNAERTFPSVGCHIRLAGYSRKSCQVWGTACAADLLVFQAIFEGFCLLRQPLDVSKGSIGQSSI